MLNRKNKTFGISVCFDIIVFLFRFFSQFFLVTSWSSNQFESLQHSNCFIWSNYIFLSQEVHFNKWLAKNGIKNCAMTSHLYVVLHKVPHISHSSNGIILWICPRAWYIFRLNISTLLKWTVCNLSFRHDLTKKRQAREHKLMNIDILLACW